MGTSLGIPSNFCLVTVRTLSGRRERRTVYVVMGLFRFSTDAGNGRFKVRVKEPSTTID